MSPLTAVVSFVADRLGEPVEEMDEDGIQQARANVRPTNRLYAAVTGAVHRGVGITYGTAPARDDHEIPLRIYRPRALGDSSTDVPVVMWFHGGGWVLGNVVDYDPICTFIAAEVGCVVVSVDYRMAPEHRAPVAAHDCVDATTWVGVNGDVLRADTTTDGRRRRLRRWQPRRRRGPGAARPRRHPPPAPGLIYPATDLTMSSPSVRRARERRRSSPSARWTPSATTTSHPGRTCATRSSPRSSAGSTGLPPALIQTADLDPIRDDGIRYADALRAAGVPVRLTNYLKVPHGFASMPGCATGGGPPAAVGAGSAELRAALRPSG